MIRYENEANTVISVPINDSYKIYALPLWDKSEKLYHTRLYLVRKDIGNLVPIMEHENIEIKSDIKTVKIDLARYISNLNSKGSFKDYIQRYEYEQKCFDRGNESFEQERLGKVRGML